MKNTAKFVLLLSAVMLVLASCSKEKKIEKQLVRKDGKWEVTNLQYRYYLNNELEGANSFVNAGTIEFNKKGSFVMTLTLSGSTQTTAGTWTNSEDKITITVNGETTVLRIDKAPKKGEMDLEEVIDYNDTNEKEVYMYHLERAD
jgi:hypothetical protein